MYNVSHRKAVLIVYNFNGSMRKTAEIFKHAPSTISRWSRNLEPKPRLRKGRFTQAMKESIRLFLSETPRFSSLQVVAFIKSMWNFTISRQHAHRLIRECGFTYKRTRRRGGGPRIRKNIGTFLRTYKQTSASGNTVSFDESGFDQRMKPVYAYAPSGKPAVVQVSPCGDRTRYNLLMAIHQSGKPCTTLIDHSTKGSDVADFIRSMPYAEGSTILMDNASIHKTKDVMTACNDKRYNVLFTPPYSPEYNPIEMVFGSIKNDFYIRRYDPSFGDAGLRETIHRCVDDWVESKSANTYFRHVDELVDQHLTLCPQEGENNGQREVPLECRRHRRCPKVAMTQRGRVELKA